MSIASEDFLEDFDFIFPATRRVRGYDAAGAQKHIQKFIAGAPEVMVKISSYSKTRTGLKMHVDYISRESTLPVYTHVGDEFTDVQEALGHETKLQSLHGWANAVDTANTNPHESRRLTANIVLSMPPGVHEEGFREGVRTFLIDQFDGHDYLTVFHDDQDHYHAHVVVATEGYDGSRLATDREDLQLWRERFAMHLENEGIAADATPAFSRGESARNVPRWLSETVGRGTNRREEESPSYDAKKESEAIRERAKAWQRIGRFLSINNHPTLADRVSAWTENRFSDPRFNEMDEGPGGR